MNKDFLLRAVLVPTFMAQYSRAGACVTYFKLHQGPQLPQLPRRPHHAAPARVCPLPLISGLLTPHLHGRPV